LWNLQVVLASQLLEFLKYHSFYLFYRVMITKTNQGQIYLAIDNN
jgi:hypothetical protein